MGPETEGRVPRSPSGGDNDSAIDDASDKRELRFLARMHVKPWFATSCAARAASIRAWAVASSSDDDCPLA